MWSTTVSSATDNGRFRVLRSPKDRVRLLHHYNHHRPYTAIGKVPPITRLTNLSGQYT